MDQAVLFDLDGTLLPMNQEEFVRGYFGALCRRFVPKGYDPKKMVDTVWKGTAAMVKNDGSVPNRDRFWAAFAENFGSERLSDIPEFDDFYSREFHQAKACTQPTPLAAQCVKTLREKGYRVVLATNPIFPRAGTLSRIGWAGLDPEDFEWITTYENSTFCKPNPAYYTQICDALGLNPTKCWMVGNDAREDLAAAEIGMKVFLVTDCLIPAPGVDVETVPHGTLAQLLERLQALPAVCK